MHATQSYLPSLLQLVQEASQKILAIYHRNQRLNIQEKADHTPLTEADLISHEILINGIQKLTPTIPIISEESQTILYEQRKLWNTFWLIDPLDGTKEFITKTDDFVINIALIENHQPIFGLVHVPVTNITYYAHKNGTAIKRFSDGKEIAIHPRPLDLHKTIIIASRRYANNLKLQNFLHHLKNIERLSRGSALKFCLIAEGCADAYPRFGDTSEWDTAAGQCILEAAGGQVIDTNGQALRYNTQQTFLNPHFLAVGDNVNFWRQLLTKEKTNGK